MSLVERDMMYAVKPKVCKKKKKRNVYNWLNTCLLNFRLPLCNLIFFNSLFIVYLSNIKCCIANFKKCEKRLCLFIRHA